MARITSRVALVKAWAAMKQVSSWLAKSEEERDLKTTNRGLRVSFLRVQQVMIK
jgi:hypothetical protein